MSNTRFNADICFVTKVARRSPAAPFLCNFRANFAAAIRIGKATNAGQALVRQMPYGTINGNLKNRIYFYKLKLKTKISNLVFLNERMFYIMATRTRKDKTSIQGLLKQLRKSTNCRSF